MTDEKKAKDDQLTAKSSGEIDKKKKVSTDGLPIKRLKSHAFQSASSGSLIHSAKVGNISVTDEDLSPMMQEERTPIPSFGKTSDIEEATSNLTADHFKQRNTRSMSESSFQNAWSENKFTRAKSTKKSAQDKSDKEAIS